jgi:cysteine desulfurase family protein
MIYLDNAATSFPKPQAVIDTVTTALTKGCGTPGRGLHEYAVKASGAVGLTRRAVARFFGVFEDFRVVFTYSATDALNTVIKGFVNEGDHVLMSSMEHNSVSRPLLGMAADKKISLDIVQCDSLGYMDLEDLKSRLRPETRLVVVNHASNVTGTLQDAEKIGEIVREHGAYLLLDAAQTAGRLPIDVEAMKVDFLAAAGHKGLFGTQGTGILILGSRVKGLRPFREGGTGFDSLSELQPVSWPEAYESGTHNVPGILSIGAGVGFINDTGIEEIASKEARHLRRIWERLEQFENIRLYGPKPGMPRVPVLSFNIVGWEPGDVGDLLNLNHGISSRTGLQCAPLAHKIIGTHPEGTVRVSPGYFNTDDEVESFLEAVTLIAEVAVPEY